MKIGFFTNRIDRQDNGPGIYRRNLFEALKSELNSKHELFAIHFSSSNEEIYGSNEILVSPSQIITKGVATIGKLTGRNVKNPKMVNFSELKVSLEEDFDLLHLESIPWYRPFWLGKINTNLATTIHFNVRPLIHSSHYNKSTVFRHKHLIPRFLNLFDGIFTVSEHSKKIHSDYYNIPDEKIFVTHNAPPSDLPQINETSIKNYPQTTNPYILHVSNKSFYKNPEGVVAGYAHAKRQYDLDMSLVLIGGNWKETDVEKYTTDEEVLDDIYNLGYVDREDLAHLYSNAEFVFLPSFSEAFPFVIIESLYYGTPVLTTGEFGLPTLFEDSCMYISNVHDNDQLAESLVKMESNYRGMESKAREVAQRYTWEKTAKKTVNGYKQILNNN